MALASDVSRVNYGSCLPQDTWLAAPTQVFFQGSIILVKADGLAYVGGAYAASSAGFVLGVASFPLDSTGSSTSSVIVQPGTFGNFTNSASADAIAEDDRGKVCYLVDDDTVALTDNGGARTVAGRIHSLADDLTSVVVQFEVLR